MAETTWTYSEGTATYVNADNNTTIKVTGVKDASGLKIDNLNVIVSKGSLDEKTVTISVSKTVSTGAAAKSYKLALNTDLTSEGYVYDGEYLWSAPVINTTAKAGSPITVTYKYQTSTYYKLNGGKIVYSATPTVVKTQNIFTISGVNNTSLIPTTTNQAPSSDAIAALFTAADGETAIAGTMDAAIAVVPKAEAFTTANMVLNSTNRQAHTIALPSEGIATEATYDYQWSFNNATAAAYKETKNLYYEKDSAKQTIKYNAAKTSAIATVNGISKDFKTDCEKAVLIANGYKTGEEGSEVLSDEAFRTAVLGVKTSYGDGETAPTDVDALLAAKAAYKKSIGTKTGAAAETAALNAAKTAYFKDATVMGQVSTRIAAKIVVAGAASLEDNAQLTPSGNITVDSSLFDNKNITLAKGNNTNTPATKATFDLVRGNYTKPAVEYAWSFSGNTGATYKQTQPAFYTVDDKGNIKYTATKTSTLATLNGLNPNFKIDIEAEVTAGITEEAMTAENTSSYTSGQLAALKAYNKSLYGKEEPTSTEKSAKASTINDAKKANALKQAKAAYLKDENIAKTVSDKIDDVLGGEVLTTGTVGVDSFTAPANNATLTVDTKALGATNVTLVQGKPLDSTAKTTYTLALADGALGKTYTPEGGSATTPTTPTVTIGDDKYALIVAGATAKLQKLADNGSAKYEEENTSTKNTIKYTKPTVSTAAADTLFTINGLKAGIVADGAGNLNEFITVDATNHTITLTSKALGTANIVLKDTDTSNDWKLSITEDTANNIYAPTYEADTNGAAETPTTEAPTTPTTPSGEGGEGGGTGGEGRQATSNSSIDPVSHDETEGQGGESGSSTPTQSAASLAWSATNGTAKLTQTIQKGHTLSHDGKTIYYNAGTGKTATKEIVLATVTGLATSINNQTKADEALDYSFPAGNAPVIKVNSKALGGKVISVNGTGNFELGFIEEGDNKITETSGSTLGKSVETGPALTLPNATAKYSTILGPGYSIDTTKKKINYLAKGTKETVYAQISGFATLYKDLSNEAKTAVTADTMKTKPAYPPEDLGENPTEAEQTAHDKAQATYEDNKSYYDALNAAYKAYSDAGITTSSTAAEKTAALKAAQQAYIDSKANESIVLNADSENTDDDKVFTIKKDALTSKTNIVLNTKEDYKIKLSTGEGIPTSESTNPAWSIKGTTATYQKITPEHYIVYQDTNSSDTKTYDVKKAGKQITYVREKLDPTVLVKFTGINPKATADYFDIAEGKTTVTLKYGALGTTPIVMTASGDYKNIVPKLDSITVKYQGTTADNAKATLPANGVEGWIISGATATYQKFTPAYYVIDAGNNKITYNAISDKGSALITLTGLKSGLTTDANGVIEDISVVMYDEDGAVTEDTDELDHYGVVLKAGALDTKNGGKVTIKGTDDYADATLALSTESGNYSDGTAKAPTAIAENKLEFSYNGANVVLQGPSGTAGYVCDGKIITYSDGTANRPTLASIAGLATDLKASSSVEGEKAVLGDVVQLSGGVITLSKSALNAKAVTITTTGDYKLELNTAAGKEQVTVVDPTVSTVYQNASTQSGNVLLTQGAAIGDYEVDSTGKKVTYYTAPKTTILATVTGVVSNLNEEDLTSAVSLVQDPDNPDLKVINITEDAVDEKKTTIKVTTAGYTLKNSIGEVFDGINPALIYNDKTKKVELARTATSEGWGISADAKSIVYYEKGDKAPALATITGLNIDTTLEGDALAEALAAAIKVGDLENGNFVESTSSSSSTSTDGDNQNDGNQNGNGEPSGDGRQATNNSGLDPVSHDEGDTEGGEGTTPATTPTKTPTYLGHVIQISSDVLGASNVSLAGTDYTLALDSGVNTDSTKTFDGWIVSGTKATYNTGGKKAYYTLNAKSTGITYTAPKKGKEGVVVSGLKSGILPNNNGEIAGLTLNDKVITIDDSVLGKTSVTVTGEGYTLNPTFKASSDDATANAIEKTATSYEWEVAANGTTANLKEIVTAGFKLNGTSNTLEYVAAKTTNVGTLTGFNTNIKSDAEYEATQLTTEVMEGNDLTGAGYIAAQKAYNKSLYGSEEPDDDDTAAIADLTEEALAAKKATALAAAQKAYVIPAMTETLNGYLTLLKVTTTGEGENVEYGTEVSDDGTGTIWQVNDGRLLGQGDLKLAGNNDFILAVDATNYHSAPEADSPVWIVNGTTAEYYATGYNSEYYTASTDGKTVTYNAATKIGEGELEPTITLTGLKSGLKSGSWSNFGVKVEEEKVTLTQALLPTSGTLAISGDVPEAEAGEVGGGEVGDGETETETDSESESETTKSTSYKLALKNVIESDVSSTNANEPDFPAIEPTLNNTTLTLKQAQKKGYVLNYAENEITYINADRTATLATISNLASGLNADSATNYYEIAEGDSKEITLTSDAIGTPTTTKKVTISSSYGYTITAGTNEAAAADVGTDGYQWTVSNNNASYTYTSATGPVTASDGKSITYYPSGNTATLVTITGYNKNLTADNFNGNSTADPSVEQSVNVTENKVIELGKAVVEGTTAVKISTANSEYKLALSETAKETYGLRDEAVETGDDEADWVFDTVNGKAEYVACTKAYYALDADAQTLTYTPAVKKSGATAIFTIEGLKKNVQFTPDDVVYEVPTAEEGQTPADPSIILSENALDGITKATLTFGTNATEDQKEKVRLALGKDTSGTQMTATVASDPTATSSEDPRNANKWTFSGTTATLNQFRSKGYALSDDGKTITRIASDETATLATVSGIRNATAEATAKVTQAAMEDESASYEGALLDAQNAYSEKLTELGVDADTANAAQKTQALNAAKAAYIETANAEIIAALVVSEVETKETVDDEEVTTTTPTITVGNNALNATEVTVAAGKDVDNAPTSYTLALDSQVPTSENVTNDNAWLVSGTTAEFVNCVPEHYDLSGDKIIYTAIAKAKVTDEDGNTTEEDEKAKIVITGLKSGATTSGISLGSGTVDLSRDVLSTTEATKISSTSEDYKDYTLAFADTGTDLRNEDELDQEWNQAATSTLQRTQPAKTYLLSEDGKSITYSATAKTTTLATITGLVNNPRLELPDSEKTISIAVTNSNDAPQIDTTKNNVTVDGVGYTFSFAEDYNGDVTEVEDEETQDKTYTVNTYAKISGGANDDIITANGVGLEINGGKGDDTITLAQVSTVREGGNKIVFAEGDGNDTVTNFNTADVIQMTTATNSITRTNDETTEDVVINFGTDKGSITLKEYTGEAVLKIAGGATANNLTADGDSLEITGGDGNDTITATGNSLEIIGGKGNDTINLDDERETGNKIVFDAGDGDDVVVNFSESDTIKTSVEAESITITRPTDDKGDVVVNFGDDSITLKDYGTKVINFVDSSGTAIEVTEGAPAESADEQSGRSLLYSDNFMETTPVLSSITDITANDYSVGNIESAADLTKLTKEETPIIASSK